MTRLAILAPCAGVVVPLADVCDEVFATGLAGDGVAIEPLEEALYAPCAGVVGAIGDARHALTLRIADGVDLLLHVGIDTVALRGEGFERCADAGSTVRPGDLLLRFDLDRIAREARSAATPVLLAGGGRIVRRCEATRVAAGDFLFEIEFEALAASGAGAGATATRRFRIPFDHGLHARPAAQLAAALRGLDAEVELHARGRGANARSTTAMMALGLRCGDELEARARGGDAGRALDALAGLLSAITASPPEEASPSRRPARAAPAMLDALAAVRGFALGTAVRYVDEDPPLMTSVRGIDEERRALESALAAVAAQLDASFAAADGAQRDVLDAHRALLLDPDLHDVARRHISAGSSAGVAWRAALRAGADSFAALGDARMAERGADLRDLERQVLRVLAGEPPLARRALPADAIVLADELLPSQLVALDPACVAGIAMARGGPTSHVALLAAARGWPMLVSAGDALLDVADGTTVLLDADRGRIAFDPTAAEIAQVQSRRQQRAREEAAELAASAAPASTRDGVTIAVLANIGAVAEAAPAIARGAEGCGLLRSEFLFLDRRAPPDEEEQLAAYAALAAAFAPRPLTLRTLDVGGDKPLAYLPLPHEDNPVLGLRGLRVSLRAPELLRTQLRAAVRAASHGRLRVMLPMVNEPSELRRVRALLHEVARELGLPPPPLGVMIETPAAALLAPQLAAEAEFLSIGSNDLAQYVFAIDRGHRELAAQLDGLHPALLKLIGAVAEAGRGAGCSVSLCGGLASDVDALPFLIGLGVHELSVVPGALPRIKRRVRELDAAACVRLARRALDCDGASGVRALLAEFTAAETTSGVADAVATR